MDGCSALRRVQKTHRRGPFLNFDEEIKKLYDSARVDEVLEVYGLNRKKNGETFPVHVRFCKLDAEFALANVRKITGKVSAG